MALQRFPLLKSILLTALLGMTAGCPATEDATLIDQLPAWSDPQGQPLSPQQQTRTEQALSSWLSNYMKGEYTITAQRYFLTRKDFTTWNAVEKLIGNYVEQDLGGTQERYSWHDPGIDLVAVWKVGDDPRRIAVAMTKEPLTDGRRLIGYFELTKK